MGIAASFENTYGITLRGYYFQFRTAEGVFSRGHLDPGTRLLAEHMSIPERGVVLDLACGYGPLGIIAAKLNPELKVILTDNNHLALKLARGNASLNNVRNVEFLQGNVYAPLPSLQFNLIVSNPPLSAGFSTVSEIIRGAGTRLLPSCPLELVVRKGFEMVARECERGFGNVKILARGSGYRVFHCELTKT